MNTRKLYTEYFSNFLKHKERMILIFKGSWGVGKTYFWKDFIKQNLSVYDFRAYSYVSLFGLTNYLQIKEAIFANAEIQNSKWQKFNKSDRIKNIISLSKKLPALKEYNGIVTHFENQFIDNFLICFDDIERRSDNTDLKSFLGFCNQLKEENNCKIVVVFNEDEINKNPNDLEHLNKYREKVIDQELLFSPTLKENYDLIFSESSFYDIILNTVEMLAIVNLRILKKIKWNLEYFDQYILNCEETVRQYFLQRIVLISYFLLNEAKNINKEMIFSELNDHQYDENKFKEKETFLNNYNYYYVPYDKFIIEYIMNNKFDEEGFKSAVDEVNENEKKSQILSKINVVWDEYSKNFKLLPDEFKNNLITLLETNIEYLNQNNFESIINALKKLDTSFDENYWWEKYLILHINDYDLHSLKALKNKIKSEEIKNLLSNKIDSSITNLTIKDVIYHIVNRDSWSNHHIDRLKLASEDDFYNWLLTEEDENLLYNLRNFLQMFNSSSSDADHRNIGLKITNALNRIAKIDKLKELRVREFFNIKENV